MTKSFDVFLSHNSKDKPAVRELAEALRGRGINVWFDEWNLVPGRRWVPELEKAIETTSTIAVLVGESGMGPWEQPEYEGALREFVRRGLPVIPVLLPGAPAEVKVPLFLSGFTWVDSRSGLTDEVIDQLQWGVTGKRPDRSKPPSTVSPEAVAGTKKILAEAQSTTTEVSPGTGISSKRTEDYQGIGSVGWWIKNRLKVGLVAIVLALLAVSSLQLQERKPSVGTADPDKTLVSEQPSSAMPDPSKRVLYYKGKILSLRDDIEDPNRRRTLDTDMRELAKHFADRIGEINEGQLNLNAKIIQHEYRGWALLMAVGTFPERPSQGIAAARRIDFGQKAVAEFNLALDLMADITRQYRAGVPAAIPTYRWMTGISEDLNRTHYLKAVALAVIARANGHTPRAALAELSAVKPTYLVKFPPENNPDLAWALSSHR